MNEDLRQPLDAPGPWLAKLERYLAAGRKARALRLLDRVIETDLPLFAGDPKFQEERRLAWLCRIDLLREWGRVSEALAWTCFECEFNPDNVAAHALKERLKVALNLKVRKETSNRKRSRRKPDEGLWSGIAGMREIKLILERDVILPLQNPELYERYRVDLPNGLLFYGPSGCGKTLIARKLAEILKFEFLEVRPSDLASTYVHGTQKKIGALFRKARKNAPTVIFLDELDALVPNRGDSLIDHHYSAEVNEFLVQINECWKSKILVIGATNLLNKIDPAILRPGRMDKRLFIGPPAIEARVELLRMSMKDRPQESIGWLRVAEACELYTAAEIDHIINEAARMAISDHRPIKDEDILRALEENPPSLKEDEIDTKKVGFLIDN